MTRRIALIWTVLAVLVAGVIAAVAVTVTDEGGTGFGSRDGMMSSRGNERADGRADGQADGRGQAPGWQGPGGMMRGGMHGMSVDSEYAYLAGMVAHHEEAVAAAQQLQRSQRAEMREFGKEIVASQSAQIDQMRRWLADWYPDRSGRVDYQPMMRDLTGLSGDRLDRVFLKDMLWHHMGAVMMSQQLLMRGVAHHEQVQVLAQTIRDEQHAEILQMQQWLRDWFGGGWRHGGMWGGQQGGYGSGGPWTMR